MFLLSFFKKPKAIAKTKFSIKMMFWIFSIFTLHVYLITVFENMSWLDSLWYSATAAVTVGFGDIAPKTIEGRFTTMILIYIGLIFVIAKTASDWFELVANKVERKMKGIWKYSMKNHIVIIGHPKNKPEIFIKSLIEQLNKDARFCHNEVMLISSEMDTLPAAIADLGVKWVKGDLNQWDTLKKADIEQAKAIYFIAPNSTATDFDSFTLDVVSQLRDRACIAYIIAEAVNVNNDARFKKHGVDAVIRVMHGYPNIAARALTVKGSEEVIQNIFSDEDEECIRIDLIKSKKFKWAELVMSCLTREIGTPIACIDTSGKYYTSPLGKELDVQSVFIIASTGFDKNTFTLEL